MMEKLNGKKTYIVAALGLVWAVVGYIIGEVDVTTLTEFIFGALAVAGIRHGIAKM